MSDARRDLWLDALLDGQSLPDEARRDADLAKLERLRGAFAALQWETRDRATTSTQAPLFRWDHLEVCEHLGEGGFGEVYRAWDTVLEREVALKLRRRDDAFAPAAGRAFIEEARRLARVRHPHVLAVHGAGVHDGRAGLWTDLIEGRTLKAEIEATGPMGAEGLVELLDTLADALVAVHAAGLVHGDLKPANVMRERGGTLVLMDFGAGGHLDDGGTWLGTGSPHAMAPEQARGERVGPAADLYALGAVAYHAATGAHQADAPRALRARRDLPAALVATIEALCDPDPARRPAAAELRARCAQWRVAPERRRRQRLRATAMAALALAAVASVAGYWQASRARRDAEAERDRATAINATLRELIGDAAPGGLGPQATLGALLDRAPELVSRRLAQRPAERAELLSLLARVQGELFVNDKAAALSKAAMEASRSLDPHGATTLRLESEALFYAAQAGNAQAVLDATRELGARAARQPGLDPAVRARLELDRAEIELMSLRTHHDEALRRAAVARLERVVADAALLEPLDRVRALTRLATVMMEMRESQRGEELSTAAVALAEREFGVEHGRTAWARLLLAWSQMGNGHDAEAAALMQADIARYRDKLGPDSRVVIDERIALANALVALGRHEEAIAMGRAARADALRVIGRGDRSTLDAGLITANALGQLGRVAERAALMQELYDEAVASGLRDSRYALMLQRDVADSARLAGDAARGRAVAADCASRGAPLIGDDHYIVVACRALAAGSPMPDD